MLYPRILRLSSLGVLIFLCVSCRGAVDGQPHNTATKPTPSSKSRDKNRGLVPQKNVPDPEENSPNKKEYRNKSRTLDSLRIKIAVL